MSYLALPGEIKMQYFHHCYACECFIKLCQADNGIHRVCIIPDSIKLTLPCLYVAFLDLYLNDTCIYFYQRVLRFHAEIITTVGFQLERSYIVFNQ